MLDFDSCISRISAVDHISALWAVAYFKQTESGGVHESVQIDFTYTLPANPSRYYDTGYGHRSGCWRSFSIRVSAPQMLPTNRPVSPKGPCHIQFVASCCTVPFVFQGDFQALLTVKSRVAASEGANREGCRVRWARV